MKMNQKLDLGKYVKIFSEFFIALGVLYIAVQTYFQDQENIRFDRYKPLSDAYLNLKKESYKLSVKGKEIAALKRDDVDKAEDFIEKLTVQLYMFRDSAKIYEKRYCKGEPLQPQISNLLIRNKEIRKKILQDNANAGEIEKMYRNFSKNDMKCVDKMMDAYIGNKCFESEKLNEC